MSQPGQSSNNQFIELTQFSAPEQNNVSFAGNVLKNTQLAGFKFTSLQIDTPCSDEPAVVVKRQGDVLQSIEFICSCGRKKVVNFEYEGE